MDIRITGRKMRVSEGIRNYLDEKVARFEKYAPRLVEAHVILKKEKTFFEAEISILAKHFKAFGDGRNKENIFIAIESAAQRVETQLKKYRSKVKNHHASKMESEESLPEEVA